MSKKKTEDLEEKEIKIDEPENNQPDLEDTIKEDDDKVIEETSDENNSEEKIKELEYMTDRYQMAMKHRIKKRQVKGGVRFWFEDGGIYTINYLKESYDDKDAA